MDFKPSSLLAFKHMPKFRVYHLGLFLVLLFVGGRGGDEREVQVCNK